MPIRATLAILATIAGVVLLFSFRTPTPPVAGSTALPSTSASAAPPTRTACTSAVTAPPNGEGDDNGRQTLLAAPTPCATTAPTPAPSAAGGSTPPAGTTQLRDGSYTGQDSPNQFGDVQVKAVISGGQLTDVQAVQLPSDRARSAFISQQAGPILRSEALQAHSAQIDIVSGATYTSESYAASLQSALDQARA